VEVDFIIFEVFQVTRKCAGDSRGYHSEYGNSWFNNRENDNAYYMFRSYNNCYYSSSEPVTDEEDDL